MKVAIYTALAVISEDTKELAGHVTTSFTWVGKKKLPKIRLSSASQQCTVTDIEYFESANVTVALVDSGLAKLRHNVFIGIGLEYGYELKPHITLCKGNNVSAYYNLVGRKVVLGNEYIGIFTKED